MLSDGRSLFTRTISAFPISVGTSLALESLFAPRLETIDPERKFDSIDVSKYTEIWINIATLFRNISGAVESDVFLGVNENSLLGVLQSEIEVINDLFMNEGQGFCKPIYYNCSYKSLDARLVKLNILTRQAKTNMQKHYYAMLTKTLHKLHKVTDEVRDLDSHLPGNSTVNALILSHTPYDLLSYKTFNTLSLLESHTGKLKVKKDWSSKYYPLPGKDMKHLPFNEMLLLAFGDKVHIQPSPIKLRQQIYDTSINRHWHTSTTMPKILADLSLDIKDPFVLAWLKSL